MWIPIATFIQLNTRYMACMKTRYKIIQTTNHIKNMVRTYRILRCNYNIHLSVVVFFDRLKYVCLLYSASDPYLKVKDPMIFQSE